MARIDRPTNRIAMMTLAAAAAALPLGCTANRTTYLSTTFSPKSVEVIDAINDETLWTMDVPVGQKLVLDFDSPNEDSIFLFDPAPPVVMTWELHNAGRKTIFGQYYVYGALDKGKVELPGRPVVARMTIRPLDAAFDEPMPELFEQTPAPMPAAAPAAAPVIVPAEPAMAPSPAPQAMPEPEPQTLNEALDEQPTPPPPPPAPVVEEEADPVPLLEGGAPPRSRRR
ncbi:MAG: hypothetical protein RLN76_05100 [Phycisphaeraceae bacterium]